MLGEFEYIEISPFWNDNDYSLEEYVCDLPSDDLIVSIEKELGYKLPESYINLMKLHNGGTPYKNCFPTTEPTSWAKDHVAIIGISGIGRKKPYALCGELGSQFMIDQWGYPNIGVVICDCPSGGHDLIMLDYGKFGKNGEPEVVHVDQELNFEITFLATNFELFIKGLVKENDL